MRNRRINERILVLCEGYTEWLYVSDLKNSLPRGIKNSIDIEIDYDSDGNPKNLLRKAITKRKQAIRERNRYNEIWLFFDNDNCPNLPNIFKEIEQEGLKFAYSSMCIEHWFILHFERCGRTFQNGQEATNYLKKLWVSYHKTKIKHYSLLKDKLSLAIENAKVLNNLSTENYDNLHDRNPYFTIPDLIEKFNKLGS